MAEYQPSLFDDQTPYIKGKPIHVLFHNPESMYTVSRFRIVEHTEAIDDKEIAIVGTYPPMLEDELYTVWGEIRRHPKYGLQYVVQHFRKELPKGKDGVIHYLSSDLFPGVGKKTAQRIVHHFGEHAISTILENPACLDEIPHMSEQVRQSLHEKLMEYQGLEQIMVKLAEYGIGLATSVHIYNTYQEHAMEVLQENPYRLIEDVDGIGFRRADAIAEAVGIEADAPERVQAAIQYYLWEQAEQNGHVFYPYEQLLPAVIQWLEHRTENEATFVLDTDMIDRQLLEMAEEGKLFIEEDRIYLPSLFLAEKGFAKKVEQLLHQSIDLPISTDEFYRLLGSFEEASGVSYSEKQKEAIVNGLQSAFMILTGGPGTGKTTVIRAICHLFSEIHECSIDPADYTDEPFPFLLVAPTGRAAKRMEESTGIPAVTIHRLLGWKGGSHFDFSEDQPLSGKLLIVDEVSMMDQWLANQLFRALPDNIQVILVGDEDQLPSVGPGQVLRDLIHSQCIPVIELTDIYRQENGSSIVTMAHYMKEGHVPPDFHHSLDDRRFFPCPAAQAPKMIAQVVQSALRKGHTWHDVQVLAPMYRGEAGIDALNETLQEVCNPPAKNKREVRVGETMLRSGDKVLQLVNSPEKNVFNGDMGHIQTIVYAKETKEKEDQIIVQFDQQEVAYPRKEWKQLTLAYCCSIHKAQGSEFSIVILPVLHQYKRMLRRNLVYTAITRAKQYLIICGEERAMEYAIAQGEVSLRYSTLMQTLQEKLGHSSDSTMDMKPEKNEITSDRKHVP